MTYTHIHTQYQLLHGILYINIVSLIKKIFLAHLHVSNIIIFFILTFIAVNLITFVNEIVKSEVTPIE